MNKIRSVFREAELLYYIERGIYARQVNYKPEEDLCTVYLEPPVLQRGEEIYISTLDKRVRINSSIRSSDGGIVYYISYDNKNSTKDEIFNISETELVKIKKLISELKDENRELESKVYSKKKRKGLSGLFKNGF